MNWNLDKKKQEALMAFLTKKYPNCTVETWFTFPWGKLQSRVIKND